MVPSLKHIADCSLTWMFLNSSFLPQLSFIRRGSAPRSKPLPFYLPFWIEKVRLSYTFQRKLYPFHVPTERLLKFSLENPLKHLDESAVVYACRDILLSVRPQTTASVGHQGTFPHLVVLAVASLPAFGTGCVFSRACHWLNAFPRFSLYVCFPALCPNWKFYRTLHCTGCVFFRAFHRLHVSFPRLPLAICFPELCGTGVRWHVFQRLAPIECFPALETSLFSHVLQLSWYFLAFN